MSGDEEASRRVPDEITADILSRLPVKSLLRSCAACKQWRSDIHSPHFIDAHLDRARHSCPPSLAVIDPLYPRGGGFTITILALDDSWNPSPILSRSYPGDDAYLVGSSNGLLCVSLGAGGSKIEILNPATGESLALPEPPVRLELGFCHFGFHPPTKEYKVVHFFISDHSLRCQVYTLGLDDRSGSWKLIDDVLDSYLVWGSITIKGGVYWITSPNTESSECYVACFDFGAERFTKIFFPDKEIYGETDHQIDNLMEIDGKLSVAVSLPTNTLAPMSRRGRLDLWMLGEDEKSGWIRKYSFKTPWEKCYAAPMLFHGGMIVVCSHSFNGECVLHCRNLGNESESWKEIYSFRHPVTVRPHVESLVPVRNHRLF